MNARKQEEIIRRLYKEDQDAFALVEWLSAICAQGLTELRDIRSEMAVRPKHEQRRCSQCNEEFTLTELLKNAQIVRVDDGIPIAWINCPDCHSIGEFDCELVLSELVWINQRDKEKADG
jgi:uncharacterized protein with PIN domain